MDNKDYNNRIKVVVYGGNGFVGTRVAQQLAGNNVCAVCVSRTGHKPLHLKDQAWSESIRWCKGDASQPSAQLLSSADVLICLVGAAPLPTFSKEAFDHQLFMNGTSNVNAIEAAADAGIKRVVLLGAHIPWPMRNERLAYSKGKRLALESAKAFSQLSDQHSAVVLQPGAIYGTRHLKNGKSIPLGMLLKPLSWLMPRQFVSVNTVAKRIVKESLSSKLDNQSFTIIKPTDF